ncbi:MAG: hypothetical protein J7647_19690 [Cyanobacteria bacterium SBLK]|nr:hypothetical protein [Cyanobacteria bacterium SBLK]
MSWLKLTSDCLYLMKGGSDEYLDKIVFGKLVEGESKTIKEFPRRWFSSVQWPRTIILNLADNQNTHTSFSENEILKVLEIPVSSKLINHLKESKTLPDIISTFFEKKGNFLDDFYKYTFTYKDEKDREVSKSYEVLPIKFEYSQEVRNEKNLDFPFIPFNEEDPDFNIELPSFADEILFPIIFSAGFTIRPSLAKFSPVSSRDPKIRASLRINKRASLPINSSPVSLRTLEKALQPKMFQLDGTPDLSSVAQKILKTWGISVTFPASMGNHQTFLSFPDMVTFPEVLDALASSHNANWDWAGRSIAKLVSLPQ